MSRCLTKIAGMESSSKRRRTSSTKKSGADDARVISVKRTDVLPRQGVASAGRRKPIAELSVGAPTEVVAAGIASSKKRIRRREQTDTVDSRTKTTRAAGRASGKLKKPAAKEVTRNDESAMTVLEAPAVGGLAAVETELVVEPSAILEETTIAMPVTSGSHPGQRSLVRTASRLLSRLLRWTSRL